MKSKAPLVMMEQIIMVLVFALASALCLQTFVLAGKISEKTEAENRAAMEVQNVAETIKLQGLDQYIKDSDARQTPNGFRVMYDAEWNIITEQEQMVYYMDLCPENSAPSVALWKLEIAVMEQDGTELFRIPVAGQAEVVK